MTIYSDECTGEKSVPSSFDLKKRALVVGNQVETLETAFPSWPTYEVKHSITSLWQMGGQCQWEISAIFKDLKS